MAEGLIASSLSPKIGKEIISHTLPVGFIITAVFAFDTVTEPGRLPDTQ